MTREIYGSYGPNRWYNIGGAVLGVGRWIEGYIRNFPLLPFWSTHCDNGSQSWEDAATPCLVWWNGDRPIIAP